MEESGTPRFGGLAVTEAVSRGLELDGITTPMPVQLVAMAPILEGRHVVVHSGTGTGKTLAYVLPLLQRLREDSARRAAVLAPATELAMQTLRIIERYAEKELAPVSAVAGGNYKQQKQRIQKSTRIVVGTPGRMLELIADRRLKGLTTVVLDEPDPILASKDAQLLLEVLSRPPRAQLVLATATLGAQSNHFIQTFMADNLVRAEVSDNPLVDSIEHAFVSVRHVGAKDVRLARFIEDQACERAIVFVNEPHAMRHLYRYLSEEGLATVSLSQERSKLQCKQALEAFARSEARVLLTTDKAASGLSIPNVPWVLHYDLPSSPQAYVHRAGRTGRAGERGRSVAIIAEKELGLLRRYGRQLGIEFNAYDR